MRRVELLLQVCFVSSVLLWPLAARGRTDQDEADVVDGQEFVRVEVRVTAVLGEAIYLDRGAEARLEVGDRLVLRPAGRPALEARLSLVTRASSRATVLDAPQGLAPGDPGEVLVPAVRLRAPEPGQGAPEVVWEHPPEEFDTARPLLSSSAHTPPQGRALELRGRAWVALDFHADREPGGGDSWLARSGFDATLWNPFGQGGVLDVRAEVFRREAAFEEVDEGRTRLRVDRLSYRLGGTREQPRALTIGRFLHGELPELGLLDGAEFVHRRPNGDRLGASVGFAPEPFAELDTGDDLAASVFYRGFLGSQAELSYAGAYQKTWHRGDADRDLVLTTLDWRPGPVFSAHGSAWFDLYTSGTEAKDSGPELTELHLHANWRFASERGLGLSATHVRWPEFERAEFPEPSLADLSNAEATRAGAHAYTRLTERLRLRARADLWEDQGQSGAGGELELARRSRGPAFGELAVALFANDAKFVEVYGARLSVRRRGPRLGWRMAYEAAFFDNVSGSGPGDAELQHLVRLGLDREFGSAWSLSLDGDYRFGDDQDGYALGLYLSRRF